jgi:hypothetical protein
VATVAGIWRADLHAEVGPGESKAVVQSVMDSHVGTAGHVALDALGTAADLEEHLAVSRFDGVPLLFLFFVKVVFFRIVFHGAVTLKAEPIPFLDQFQTVDIVTVAALHIPMVHLALGGGAVYIDLIPDLAVREIELFGQQAGKHAI